MRNRHFILAFYILALVLASACSRSSLQTTYNSQEEKIDSYIQSLLKKDETLRVVHSNGSHRVVMIEGEGNELEKNGNIAFYYAAYVFSSGITSSNLIATNHQATAESAKLSVDDPNYELVTMSLKDAELFDGLKAGLVGVKAGEECIILFSGKYAAGKRGLGTIPANSALAYYIWVEGVSND